VCGGIVLEEALDLSSDRILNGWITVCISWKNKKCFDARCRHEDHMLVYWRARTYWAVEYVDILTRQKKSNTVSEEGLARVL
jgi:hypothetical protein